MSCELRAYVLLVLVGFLPSEIWRFLGVVLGRGIDENSEFVTWVRAVATAILAGVIAKLIVVPPGALAGVPLGVRLVAIACGFLAFLADAPLGVRGRGGRRSVLMLGGLASDFAFRSPARQETARTHSNARPAAWPVGEHLGRLLHARRRLQRDASLRGMTWTCR